MSKEPQKPSTVNTPSGQKLPQQKEESCNLPLRVSETLLKKLKDKAQRESVTTQELAAELLSEGLVLRAWEIMERKNTMRGMNNSSANCSSSQQLRNHKGSGFRGQNHTRKNNVPGRKAFYNGNKPNSGSIQPATNGNKRVMDDTAQFIEYVRNQEKNNKTF